MLRRDGSCLSQHHRFAVSLFTGNAVEPYQAAAIAAHASLGMRRRPPLTQRRTLWLVHGRCCYPAHATIDKHLDFHTPILRASRCCRVVRCSFSLAVSHRRDETA